MTEILVSTSGDGSTYARRQTASSGPYVGRARLFLSDGGSWASLNDLQREAVVRLLCPGDPGPFEILDAVTRERLGVFGVRVLG